MLASRALALDLPADPPHGRGTARFAERTTIHPFIRSIAPALDTAFGFESATAFPEVIAALVAEIEAGPLGSPAQTARSLESA